MDINKELCYKEYLMRENDSFHSPYNSEFDFYIAVKNGDIEKIEELYECDFSNKKGFGILSDNALNNLKYHFVITVALVARYCIEGGMEHETAYNLSDLYIQKADKCNKASDISKIHKDMTYDYANRMRLLRKNKIYSKPISQCIDYIYNNLHTRIYITDLAKCTGLNVNYLSRLFKKETGCTVTEYIQMRKIATAKNMLKYSNYTPSMISSILSFPNQSYFIETFKKLCGMTPKKYQDMCYRQTDIVSK